MSKQEQLLKKLQAGNFEAFKLLATGCGPFVVTYLTVRLENHEPAHFPTGWPPRPTPNVTGWKPR